MLQLEQIQGKGWAITLPPPHCPPSQAGHIPHLKDTTSIGSDDETPSWPAAQHGTQPSPVAKGPIIHRVVQVDDGAPRKDELLPDRRVVGHQPICREGRVSAWTAPSPSAAGQPVLLAWPACWDGHWEQAQESTTHPARHSHRAPRAGTRSWSGQ